MNTLGQLTASLNKQLQETQEMIAFEQRQLTYYEGKLEQIKQTLQTIQLLNEQEMERVMMAHDIQQEMEQPDA